MAMKGKVSTNKCMLTIWYVFAGCKPATDTSAMIRLSIVLIFIFMQYGIFSIFLEPLLLAVYFAHYLLVAISLDHVSNKNIHIYKFQCRSPRVLNSLPLHLRPDMHFACFQHKLESWKHFCLGVSQPWRFAILRHRNTLTYLHVISMSAYVQGVNP